MNERSLLENALSARARRAASRLRSDPVGEGEGGTLRTGQAAPEAGLIESLRHHLHAGETHYPVRPGMVELRERVGARLVELGLPDRGADGVLITASEGEALFVTLLALEVFPDGALIGVAEGRHEALLDWMGITMGPDPEGAAGGVRYRETESGTTIRILGDSLFREAPSVGAAADVLVGTLDALSGMAPFSLGFVAGAPEVVKKITKWKQASSICSPGPSQRAALWSMEARP